MAISKWSGAAAGLLVLSAALVKLSAQDGLPTGPTLVFDADEKDYKATAEETTATFTFYATNVWTNTVVIQQVFASCHCTVAHMPATPWILLPGASGAVTAEVDLTDKEDGTFTKTLTFFTSVGERVLTLNVSVPKLSQPTNAAQTEAQRKAAMTKATADPMAIFKGDCASCHVEKARGLLGKDLYVAACGICHDSPHRASFVPDLHALKQPTDLDYWKNILAKGKPKTLMPAFAESAGGPLSPMQVTSLVDYLDKSITNKVPAKQ